MTTKASLIDLNGNEMILDADGDTSITADTDDQIDFKIGGTDRLIIDSSGNLQVKSGEIDMQGGNKTVKTSTGFLQLGTSGSHHTAVITAGSERMRIDSSGNVGIACTPHFPFDVQLNSSRRIGFNYSDSQNSILSHDGSGNIETLGLRGNTILFYSDYDASNPDGVERMRIDASGYLYVGTTTRLISGTVNAENVGVANVFTAKVSNNGYYNFAGSNSSGSTTFYVKGDGDYYFAGSSQSDRDLKENIQPITESSLAKVKLLEPKTFNFKASEGYATNTKTGFIAQEVAEIFGTETGVASGTDGQKDMGIDTTGIVAHLTKAIQEQQAQIEALQSEINTLKGE